MLVNLDKLNTDVGLVFNHLIGIEILSRYDININLPKGTITINELGVEF
jgi:hypothetical protein